MIILIIGGGIPLSAIVAFAQSGYDRPVIASEPLIPESFSEPKCEHEECPYMRDDREYDRAINREQAKRDEVRFKKWSHQKPRAYRSQRRR